MREVELKLLIKDADAPLIATAARSAAGGAGRKARLLTRYFDTPDGALGRANIALRLRREGRRWCQTVKIRRKHTSGLSSADEIECPAPGGRLDIARIADPAVREEIASRLNGTAPEEVFETDFTRTRFELAPDGLGRVELALDQGVIRAGSREVALAEAEFELVEGDPAALFAAARAVLPEGAVVFSSRSKAERGALVAAGEDPVPPPAVRKAREVALDPAMTAEEAGAAVLAECLDQIAANVLAVLSGDAPEGPHQLRIGLRRLRTALRLWRPVLGGEELLRLSDEAKWLGAEVGRLRDLDVAIVDLIAPAAKAAPEEPGFARLTDAVEGRARAERAALRGLLVGRRVQGFVLDLARFVTLRGWIEPSDHGQTVRLARPVCELATTELDRVLARVTKRAKGIEGLDIEARHELRKSLKGYRYAVEFFAPLYPKKRVKALLGPLRELQDLFGALNDLAMAEALFMAPDAPAADNPTAARAAGRLIGARGEKAEEDWTHVRARWKALGKVTPFWR